MGSTFQRAILIFALVCVDAISHEARAASEKDERSQSRSCAEGLVHIEVLTALDDLPADFQTEDLRAALIRVYKEHGVLVDIEGGNQLEFQTRRRKPQQLLEWVLKLERALGRKPHLFPKDFYIYLGTFGSEVADPIRHFVRVDINSSETEIFTFLLEEANALPGRLKIESDLKAIAVQIGTKQGVRIGFHDRLHSSKTNREAILKIIDEVLSTIPFDKRADLQEIRIANRVLGDDAGAIPPLGEGVVTIYVEDSPLSTRARLASQVLSLSAVKSGQSDTSIFCLGISMRLAISFCADRFSQNYAFENPNRVRQIAAWLDEYIEENPGYLFPVSSIRISDLPVTHFSKMNDTFLHIYGQGTREELFRVLDQGPKH